MDIFFGNMVSTPLGDESNRLVVISQLQFTVPAIIITGPKISYYIQEQFRFIWLSMENMAIYQFVLLLSFVGVLQFMCLLANWLNTFSAYSSVY